MLGEKIRKLRKQKKLTLEQLAGSELTKGMLSLIENNKAKPSMESLEYISNRLGVGISELMGETSIQEIREILEIAEGLINLEYEKNKDKYKTLITLIEPYIHKLSHGYESARLLDIYSRSLFHENKSGWKELVQHVSKVYDEMNLTARRASLGIFNALEKFKEHHYSEALTIFKNERKEIEAKHAFIDPMTRLDLDYYEAILYFAVGNAKAATNIMENALAFSKDKRILYLIDELYRLAAAHSMLSKDKEKTDYYLNKLKQYGEFVEDFKPLFFYKLFKLVSLTFEQHKYGLAMELINEYSEDVLLMEHFGPWLYIEKGKALYGLGHYQEAIDNIEKSEIPSYIHHPFDLSIFYIKHAYKALAYLALADKTNALQSIQKAITLFEPLPDSSFKQFSNETYNKIVETLKKA
ncbi:helix-turn-helix transcriptional regulator [Cytobacillus suaedae]|nr:helix-turn-helix transcriptional regulator [Cytobacillus suaedae]